MRRLSISNIKIPTLLGLALLFTATFLGVAIYLYNQEVDKKIRTSLEPQNINIINIKTNAFSTFPLATNKCTATP